ncbi:hypothetical protein HYH02_000902 [Chlamydomonas schloesseri]|uniref:Histone deacetylase domain-containing protein n=1 Tax=Chlamydomonas schloesseri TaxID=2026947 RepID=A0A835WWI8_9CHLO|nr:hypothetical protein HYH02_000902 [Chlamydomonas schloesseri]|eukprot:KAG2455080.1 hypothetical protein HYH02_000902 [Chlamydomonas schloesseri]
MVLGATGSLAHLNLQAHPVSASASGEPPIGREAELLDTHSSGGCHGSPQHHHAYDGCRGAPGDGRDGISHAASSGALLQLAPLSHRAHSPSVSTGSAREGVAMPPPVSERVGLGRFSASTPQFEARGMSPLVEVGGAEGGSNHQHYSQGHIGYDGSTRTGGGVGAGGGAPAQLASPFRHPAAAGLVAVEVQPGDMAAGAAEDDGAVTSAAEAPDGVHAGTGAASDYDSMMPPPPPPPHGFGTPGRSRLGSATIGHGGEVAAASAAAAAAGAAAGIAAGPSGTGIMSPMGSALSEHMPRTASLPLMMSGGTVVPQGMTAAIPIAIAGVGASGRARATTVHTPPPPAASMGAGGMGLGVGVSPSGAAPANHLRGPAQSVDYHFVQTHMAPQQQQPPQQQQQQQQFLNHSESAALVTLPQHFVGSVSPSRPVFQSPLHPAPASVLFPAAGDGAAAANAPGGDVRGAVSNGSGPAAGGLGLQLQVPQLLSPRAANGDAGAGGFFGGFAAAAGGTGTPGGAAPMSCRGPEPSPRAFMPGSPAPPLFAAAAGGSGGGGGSGLHQDPGSYYATPREDVHEHLHHFADGGGAAPAAGRSGNSCVFGSSLMGAGGMEAAAMHLRGMNGGVVGTGVDDAGGGAEDRDEDAMDAMEERASSITSSSSCGAAAHGFPQSFAGQSFHTPAGPSFHAPPALLQSAHCHVLATGAAEGQAVSGGVDSDGDEEFEDAVEADDAAQAHESHSQGDAGPAEPPGQHQQAGSSAERLLLHQQQPRAATSGGAPPHQQQLHPDATAQSYPHPNAQSHAQLQQHQHQQQHQQLFVQAIASEDHDAAPGQVPASPRLHLPHLQQLQHTQPAGASPTASPFHQSHALLQQQQEAEQTAASQPPPHAPQSPHVTHLQPQAAHRSSLHTAAVAAGAASQQSPVHVHHPHGRQYPDLEDHQEEEEDDVLDDYDDGGAAEEEEDAAATAAAADGEVVDVDGYGPAGDEEDDLLEDEEELEDDEEEDEDEDEEDGRYAAGVGWGGAAGSGPYVSSSYCMEHHYCVNCTRAFWGSVCRYCNHPAGTEVVAPEVLAAAVRCVAEGAAALAAAATAGVDGAGPAADAAAAAASPDSAAVAAAGAGAGLGSGQGVLLAYDDRCRAHLEETSPGNAADKGRSHPERPERVAAIMTRLYASGLLPRFERIEGREATTVELVAVHDADLVAELQAATEQAARAAARAAAREAGAAGAVASGSDGGLASGAAGGGGAAAMMSDSGMADAFTARRSPHILDCYFNAATAGCARLAAGSAAEVARRVVSGAARHGAAIIRPPGHHAESSVAMGFCYYNNAAVAARAAQAAGARRVVVMDWDVHHGNGTQRILYDDPSVLYMSTHRYDHGTYYPGTGDASEVGTGAGEGFTVNVPWNVSGVRDADMLAAFRHVILPIASEFRPDLVIVSAGFDAVEGDPLGGCRVSPAAFGHFTALLSSLAPSVLLLEGGYNLTATAAATEACLRVLLGEAPQELPAPLGVGGGGGGEGGGGEAWAAAALGGVSDSALESIRLALRVQAQYWSSARESQRLVEAAVEERRQRQLARMAAAQASGALQPHEHWGWHVQMQSTPPPHQQHAQVAAAAVTQSPQHVPRADGSPHAVSADTSGMAGAAAAPRCDSLTPPPPPPPPPPPAPEAGLDQDTDLVGDPRSHNAPVFSGLGGVGSVAGVSVGGIAAMAGCDSYVVEDEEERERPSRRVMDVSMSGNLDFGPEPMQDIDGDAHMS